MFEWAAGAAGGSIATAIVWGGVAAWRAWLGRGKVEADAAIGEADAAERLNRVAAQIAEGARREVEQIRAYTQSQLDRAAHDVELSRRDADESRRSAAAAWEQAAAARREAMEANANWRRLSIEIMSPYATIEHLRLLVGGDTGTTDLNGRTS